MQSLLLHRLKVSGEFSSTKEKEVDYALKRGKFSLIRIQGYFRDPFDEPMKAFNCYLEISNRVKKVKDVSRL